MRHRPGAVNRGWLALLAVVLLVAGWAGLLLATGRLGQLLGSGVPAPGPDDPLVDAGTGAQWASPLTLAIMIVLGLVLLVLGLAWLVAQIPRARVASPFRLSDDPAGGLTTVAAPVLAGAVTADVAALPGVQAVDVVVRGSSSRPELALQVKADTGTDLPELVHTLRSQVVPRFEQALGTPVHHLAVELDLVRERTNPDQIIVG